MEMKKVYFLLEMDENDFFVLMSAARSVRMSKEEFIMIALREKLERMQEEWRLAQKAGVKPPLGASGSTPNPEGQTQGKEPKTIDEEVNKA